MENIIDETIKSLSDEYEKSIKEYQNLGKKLEELVAKHKVLTDVKQAATDTKDASQPAGGTIIVKNKDK
jgi:hypothetical protein